MFWSILCVRVSLAPVDVFTYSGVERVGNVVRVCLSKVYLTGEVLKVLSKLSLFPQTVWRV